MFSRKTMSDRDNWWTELLHTQITANAYMLLFYSVMCFCFFFFWTAYYKYFCAKDRSFGVPIPSSKLLMMEGQGNKQGQLNWIQRINICINNLFWRKGDWKKEKRAKVNSIQLHKGFHNSNDLCLIYFNYPWFGADEEIFHGQVPP